MLARQPLERGTGTGERQTGDAEEREEQRAEGELEPQQEGLVHRSRLLDLTHDRLATDEDVAEGDVVAGCLAQRFGLTTQSCDRHQQRAGGGVGRE